MCARFCVQRLSAVLPYVNVHVPAVVASVVAVVAVVAVVVNVAVVAVVVNVAVVASVVAVGEVVLQSSHLSCSFTYDNFFIVIGEKKNLNKSFFS